MRHLLFVFLGLFSWGLLAQECDCASTFAWVKTTFTINDAGYAYAVEQKGEKALAGVTADVERRVATVTDRSACQQIIEEWLRFFRNGHLNIRSLGNSTSSGEPASEAVIQVSFADWERRPLTEVAFKKYLDGKEEPGYEGIWTSGAYAIAVKREGEDYVGSILRADGVYWQQDQVKLKISPAGEGMAASYYMRDHSEERFTDVSLLGNNQLEMGFINLKRTYPVREELPEVAEYYRAMSARKPYFVQLDERTTMLRIPSFSGSEKPVIDSVINANRDRITSTENFIIDIRNNGGGADRSYSELIPFLYTNPIRTVGVEYYSTELNNQRMLDFIEKPEYGFDADGKAWARESYDKLSTGLGLFMSLNEEPVTVRTEDTVLPFPRQVAILINENNGSTAEQFLLAAKQSKKVKLFGVTTMGVLDISNMYFVNSPCDQFQLGYSLTRSMRIPDMAIDDKGIMPDYYLDRTVPKYEWLAFTRRILAGGDR